MGVRGEYRLVHSGMPVDGFPRVEVGDVVVEQTDSHLWHQFVDVRQIIGAWPPEFENLTDQRIVEPGPERCFTVARVPVTLESEHVAATMALLRLQAESAVGVVAAILDERIAIAPVFEDIIVFDPAGSPAAALDVSPRIRNCFPRETLSEAQRNALGTLRDTPILDQPKQVAAARCYLKAAQHGPTPEGVILMCVALEALIPDPATGKPSFNVRHIETELRARDFDLSRLAIPIGPLAGLRADIVHHGIDR